MDQYLFLFKNFLGNLLMPVPVTLLLLLWATLLLLRRKTRWLGIITVILATAILAVTSYTPVNNQIIAQLEAQTTAYSQDNREVDYVAVLGNWHQSVTDQPITSEIKPSGIVRLVEGIRIYRMNPGSKLVFTRFKGAIADPVSYPEKMRELALALGVPGEDILIFNGPRDTADEANLLASNFADTTLVVVTTAIHMPRALYLLHRAGIKPIPAPTEHLSKPFKSWLILPSGSTLAKGEYWAHEQLGLIWAKLVHKVEKETSNIHD